MNDLQIRAVRSAIERARLYRLKRQVEEQIARSLQECRPARRWAAHPPEVSQILKLDFAISTGP